MPLLETTDSMLKELEVLDGIQGRLLPFFRVVC